MRLHLLVRGLGVPGVCYSKFEVSCALKPPKFILRTTGRGCASLVRPGSETPPPALISLSAAVLLPRPGDPPSGRQGPVVGICPASFTSCRGRAFPGFAKSLCRGGAVSLHPGPHRGCCRLAREVPWPGRLYHLCRWCYGPLFLLFHADPATRGRGAPPSIPLASGYRPRPGGAPPSLLPVRFLLGSGLTPARGGPPFCRDSESRRRTRLWSGHHARLLGPEASLSVGSGAISTTPTLCRLSQSCHLR